jgi:predicted HD phosphohydrolase
MTPDEALTFEQNRYWRQAVKLRRWDDEAKVAGLTTPSLEDFRRILEAGLAGG